LGAVKVYVYTTFLSHEYRQTRVHFLTHEAHTCICDCFIYVHWYCQAFP